MKGAKIIYLLLFLNISVFGYQQAVIKGTVYTKKEHSPLPYCTIKLSSLSLGTVSDLNGNFTLITPDGYTGNVIFSYMGFSTEMLSIEQLIQQQVIYMQEDTTTLASIIVEPKSAKELALQAIEEYENSKNKAASISKAYCNEFAVSGPDTLMNLHSIGFGVDAGENAKMTPMAQFKFFYDNTYLGRPSKEWERIGANNTPFPKPPMGCGNTFNLFKRLEYDGILNATYANEYSYSYTDSLEQTIAFKGKQTKGIIHLNSKGELGAIDMEKTKSIWSSAFDKRVIGYAFIKFAYYDGVPYIHEISCSYKKAGIRHQFAVETLVQKTDSINISGKELIQLNGYDINPLIKFNEEEWTDWGKVKFNASKTAYTKSIVGTYYLERTETIDKEQITDKINLLKALLFQE